MLLFVVAAVHAQISFTTNLSRVSDKELSLQFRATIEDGYGLNTDLVMESLEGVKLKGGLTEIRPNVYEQRLVQTSSRYSFSGYLEYYGCNDVQCLAPASVDFDYAGEEQAAAPIVPIVPIDTIATISTKDTVTPPSGEQEGITAFDLLERASSPLWTPIIEELKHLSERPIPIQRSLFEVFLICFLGGLLTVLTPCVWPIIPLTVSFFIKRSETINVNGNGNGNNNESSFYSAFAEDEDNSPLSARLWRTVVRYSRLPGVRDAAWYGVSIIVLFMFLGIIMTMVFGVNAMNALSTNAVFNVLCFFLLVIFGLSFLGLFEIRLPSSWANKLNVESDTHGGMLGMVFMALTLVVVSFSCTVPVLGYLLVEIAVQGDILAPAVGMFAFSTAIALPFTLFAVFPTILKKLPRSGYWMDHVKATLGFIELAFSLKFLSVADMAYGWGILPRPLFLTLWIIIFFLLALYHTGWLHFRKVGWLRLVVAALSMALVIYLIPGLWGAPCHLVSAFAPPANSGPQIGSDDDSPSAMNSLPAHFTDYEEGMAAAAMTGKPVLLDFTGYGCVNCRKMESAVWGTTRVRNVINKDYLVIMLHVDDRTPLPNPCRITMNGKQRTLRSVGDMWSYLESYKFGSISQPFQVILTPDGKPLTSSYGYDEDIEKYLRYLRTGLANFEKL
ncbi:MAG: thioredoxin family protein [Prevotella sp.]|nr:thioredoxin family protein [Prevotella sp.]